MPERHLILEGGFNVRDLGDYPTEEGQRTQWKTLLRSGCLDKITPPAQQQLIDYGVKTIIDLRDAWEVEKYPNVFASTLSVTYHHIPLIGNTLADREKEKQDENADTQMHEVYARYIAQCQPQIGAIMNAILDSEGCTLFHCYAGKDRTGIIAALLLRAVGVSQAVIAEDYGLSEAQVSHLLQRRLAQAAEKGLDAERFERMYAAKPQTMLALLSTIEEQYGDVQSYLVQCGVSQSQLERLRARFVYEADVRAR